jgi:putative hydrolase of the HAD superfamily
MTQALVLDFGGVVSRTLFETHALTEAALGLPPARCAGAARSTPTATRCGATCRPNDSASATTGWLARARSAACVGEDWDRMETFVQRARGADVQAVIRPEAVAAIDAAHAAGCKPGDPVQRTRSVLRRRLPPTGCRC